MKRVLFVLIAVISLQVTAWAQQPELLIRSAENGFYLDHKVAAKESFYAIGRKYNVNPKTLASFNKLDINKGLQIGQQLRIPLGSDNFSQEGNSGTPVYYKVGDKEGLMKVSSANHNVSLAKLRQWNKLQNDVVKPGQKVVVGFLHSTEMPSVTLNYKSTAPAQADAEVAKEEPKTVVEKAVPETVAQVPVQTEQPKPEKRDEAPVTNTPSEPVVTQGNTQNAVSGAEGEGFFRYYFNQQVRTTPATRESTVTSSVFKTTSGWVDAKYYMLMDNISPGTIVKITNPANNRVIYAKVLGEMSGIRQNEGLTMRISSAAASALQIAEQDKFILKINY